MNKCFIIGNVTHTPSLKTVRVSGDDVAVCSFTVAVNDKAGGEAQFFNVTAWRGLAQTCGKWLQKGKKVSVVGKVSARAYTSKDGEARCALELKADEVEFLSPREQTTEQRDEMPSTQGALGYQKGDAWKKPDTTAEDNGFTDVSGDGLPF